MTFAHPQILWLLLVFPPALLAFFWWSWRKRQALMTRFIQARLLPGLVSGASPAREKIRSSAIVLAVVCLLLALARPQWGFSWQEVKQRGLDIVVAIDTSKSMLAQDIAPNRLARAKLAALDLMQQARSDRLGLVAFAGSAFLQCPLTIDDTAFRQSLESLDVNIIPEGGTALSQAIDTALTAFKEGDNHKVLVIFSDGEDHDSGALEAAQKAAQAGLQIFAVGIGSAEGELLRIKDAKGQSDYIRDEQGNVVKSHLNETLLQQIAGATEKGFYLPLRGAKTIDALYEKGLAPLPKGEGQEKLAKRLNERYHWPLALAILLLIGEMLFPERKREPKARSAPASSVKPALRQAVALLLLLALPLLACASPSTALREYKAGKYDQALKEYEQLLQRKADDPRLHFNAGAAAYRNRQFSDAAKQFNQALELAPSDLKLQGLAYYNRGNSLYHLGESNPDPSQRTEAWKKSLQDYQNSLKLNPQDADAKFNQEFVKKKLEELKQQQQQQQQNNQDKSDQQQNQDQQQAQNQQKQDEQKDQKEQQQQQQQNQQQQAQNQPEQKKDSPQQEQQAQKQEEQKQQQQAQNQPQDQQQANQASAEKKDNADEKEQKDAAAYAAGQMTPEQAEQLLDSQKGEEKMLPVQPTAKPVDHTRPVKDW